MTEQESLRIGKEAYEAALKREGAKEALEELKIFLTFCAIDEKCNDELLGLKWSIDAIKRRLADIEPVDTKGGAA